VITDAKRLADFSKSLAALSNHNAYFDVRNHLRLSKEGNYLIVAAGNLNLYIQTAMPAHGVLGETFTIDVPAREVSEWLTHATGEVELLYSEKNNRLTLKANGTQAVFNGLIAPEHQLIVDDIYEEPFTVNRQRLLNIIRSCGAAVDGPGNRPILNNFHVLAGGCVEAADGYRVHRDSLADNAPEMLIPGEATVVIKRLFDAIELQQIGIAIGKKSIKFIADEYTWGTSISMIDRNGYPDTSSIRATAPTFIATLDTAELRQALRRVNIFARENQDRIRVKRGDNNLVIGAQSSGGEVVDFVGYDCDDTNPPDVEFTLNITFLNEALASCAETTELYFQGTKLPVEIKSGGFSAVIMPMNAT